MSYNISQYDQSSIILCRKKLNQVSITLKIWSAPNDAISVSKPLLLDNKSLEPLKSCPVCFPDNSAGTAWKYNVITKTWRGWGEAFVFIVIFFYFKNYYNFSLYFHILLVFTVSEIWVYFTSGVNKGYKFLKTSELI